MKELEEAKIKNLILIQQQQKQKVNQLYLQMMQMEKINRQYNENNINPNFISNQNSYMRFFNYPYPKDYLMPFYNNQNILKNDSYNHINYISKINGNFINRNYFPFNNNINYVNNNEKDLYINNINTDIMNWAYI